MSSQSKGRPGGVLPINAAVTKKTNAQSKPAQRNSAPRLRLIIRRLPPGLSEAEFWEALGSEWQSGKDKVDWHAFKEGKISKDPAKPSRPARAYLRVNDQPLLEALSARVKSTTFKDSKNTSSDPCLVGPPTLEFAPYNKVPSGRNRHDGRQGTIDQDQEFIDFLQSLTEPITKPPTNGTDLADMKSEKVVITPLVQFIKEKKANKAKEKEAAAAAKSSKKNSEAKEDKAKGENRPTVVVKSTAAGTEKAKATKASQENVKAASKSATQAKTATGKVETKPTKEASATNTTTPPATVTTPKPERQRGSVTAASRLIARDLGLAPKEPRTPRAAKTASATTNNNTEGTSKTEPQQKVAPPPPIVSAKPSTVATTATPNPPTGPKGNRSAQTPQAKSAQSTTQRPAKGAPQPSPGAKSAFLKHANPSQGVTEELLRTAFSSFGDVTRCEIDKKKGLGYVDFIDTEGLKKAMIASPIKVGNGQVVVLENRSPYHKRQAQPVNTIQQAGAAATNSRAPSVTSSAVVSAVTSPQPAPAVIATSEPNTPVSASLDVPSTPADDVSSKGTADQVVPQTATSALPATPNGPKGGRGGNAGNRGARGGTSFASGRGGPAQTPNRGRGGYRGRGGRGNRAGGNAGATTGAVPTSSSPAQVGSQAESSKSAKPASLDQP